MANQTKAELLTRLGWQEHAIKTLKIQLAQRDSLILEMRDRIKHLDACLVDAVDWHRWFRSQIGHAHKGKKIWRKR